MNPLPRNPLHPWHLLAILLLSLPVLTACAVKLVSGYDEHIDSAATELQRRMDAHLTRLATIEGEPEADFDANRQFYDDYEVDVRAVRVRAQAHEKNDLTEKQLELMLDSLDELRTVHEAGALGKDTIDTLRTLFNTAWGAIIKLEVAKKRGD